MNTIGYTDQIELSIEDEIISAVYHWGDGTKSICTIDMRDNGFSYRGDIPLGEVTGLVLQYMNLKASMVDVEPAEVHNPSYRNFSQVDRAQGNREFVALMDLAQRVVDVSKKYKGDTCVRSVKEEARCFIRSVNASMEDGACKDDMVRVTETLIKEVKYGHDTEATRICVDKFICSVEGIAALYVDLR